MKHRIRATFNPPPDYLRAGVLPEQIERTCDGLPDLSEQLRELIFAGDKLLRLKARLSIEITPEAPSADLACTCGHSKAHHGRRLRKCQADHCRCPSYFADGDT